MQSPRKYAHSTQISPKVGIEPWSSELLSAVPWYHPLILSDRMPGRISGGGAIKMQDNI